MKYLKYTILTSILISFGIFVDPMFYKALGSLSWFVLCFIMIIRPLSDIFPNIPILKKGVLLRKELGIACASFGIAHAVGFFLLSSSSPLSIFTQSSFWGLSNFLTWGIIALFASIPPLLTSNIYSMKFLKGNWKTIQRLSYIFFIGTALHISFIHPSISSFLSNIFPVIIWVIFWILAYKRIDFVKNRGIVVTTILLIVVMFVGQISYGAINRPERPERHQIQQDKTI